MAIKKILTIILLPAFIGIFCLGCSVPLRSYIWNTGVVPQTIIVSYIDKPEKKVQFYYTDIQQEPSYNLMDKLQKSIKAQQIELSTYQFEIPPNSIVFLEQSLNFRSLLYRSIKVGDIDVITEGLYTKDFTTKKEGMSKYTIYFKIE